MNIKYTFWRSTAFLLFCVVQHEGNVAGQFIPAPPTCPGGTITFRCTVNGSGTTIWRVGGSSNLCTLAHLSTSTENCGPSERNDAFTATPGAGFGTSATSFTSTLSTTETPALDGRLVECFGPSATLDPGNRVGSSTIQIVGPPSALTLSCVDFSEDVSGAVNVTVRWTLSGGDSADFYLINITTNAPQTPYGGLLNITTASVTQHKLTGFMAGYEYNITVRGVNCGDQEGNESEPLTIRLEDTTNNLLRVAVANVSSPTGAQLQCTFLSEFTGSAHCTVQYGTDPTYMNLPYSAESTETGAARDTVSVVLRERLNSSTVYYYTVSAVSGDITVTVRGNFTTPQYNCPLSELGIAGLHLYDIYPQCQQDQDIVTSITIPNGVINVTCYSGRQFVSVASHVCDEGYQPNATSSVRVCRDNGLWSGTTIVCAGMQTTNVICATGAVGFLNTDIVVGITAAVTGTSALTVGLLAGVLLFYCISNRRHQSSKLEAASHPQPEAVSVCNPLQQTGPQYEEVVELRQKCVPTHTRIEMKANEAYGPV